MRILYLTHVNSMDGANRSLLQLMEEMRSRHGIYPIVVCPSRGAEVSFSFAQICKDRGIECHPMPLVWFKQKGDKSFLARLHTALAIAKWTVYLIYRLRHIRFDLVHSNSSVIDMGAYLALSRGVPHVWHLREFGEDDFQLKSVLGKIYERGIYRTSTCAIAISKVVEDKFKPIFLSRIRLIYNGVAPIAKSKAARHQDNVTTFCMLGRLEPNKNQMEALQAITLLKRKTQRPFRLLLVGKPTGQDYLASLKHYVETNGLEDYVEFVAYRKDTSQVLQKCDVGLMLSTCEAFGRVTVEYMMQNLAVIVSDTGANPEIVLNGVSGMLYPLGNVEMLADKMLQLVENRLLLEKLAASGKQRALTHFTSIRNSDEIYTLYQSLFKKEINGKYEDNCCNCLS